MEFETHTPKDDWAEDLRSQNECISEIAELRMHPGNWILDEESALKLAIVSWGTIDETILLNHIGEDATSIFYEDFDEVQSLRKYVINNGALGNWFRIFNEQYDLHGGYEMDINEFVLHADQRAQIFRAVVNSLGIFNKGISPALEQELCLNILDIYRKIQIYNEWSQEAVEQADLPLNFVTTVDTEFRAMKILERFEENRGVRLGERTIKKLLTQPPYSPVLNTNTKYGLILRDFLRLGPAAAEFEGNKIRRKPRREAIIRLGQVYNLWQ